MYSEHSGDRNQNPSPTGTHWPPQVGMAEAGRVVRSGEGLAIEQFANLAASGPLTKSFLHPSFWGQWICMAGHHWVLFKVPPRILMCLMLLRAMSWRMQPGQGAQWIMSVSMGLWPSPVWASQEGTHRSLTTFSHYHSREGALQKSESWN